MKNIIPITIVAVLLASCATVGAGRAGGPKVSMVTSTGLTAEGLPLNETTEFSTGMRFIGVCATLEEGRGANRAVKCEIVDGSGAVVFSEERLVASVSGANRIGFQYAVSRKKATAGDWKVRLSLDGEVALEKGILVKAQVLGALETQLFAAVGKNDPEAVRKLLAKVAEILKGKPDLERGDIYRQTALIYAASSGKYETARLLIKNGADVNRRSERYSVLEFSKLFGTEETTAIIKAAGGK